MLRLRLASLALACGLLVTMSGCCSICDNDRPMQRLFHSQYRPTMFHGQQGQPAECECHSMAGAMHGPVMVGPQFPGSAATIPITNVPSTTQPPHIFKVPQAPATPYYPPN